jgi:glycosyltransferase involved in cell wall biosynthesis
MSSALHICLLTSGRIFELAFGGEERFTLSLAEWLASRGRDVTLMGSGFVSIKEKRLSKFDKKDVNEEITNEQTRIRVLNPPYIFYALSRLVMTTLWIAKILIVHHELPIQVLHAQDTGYSGLAAVIAGKLLKIPVIISSHGIRHKTLESTIQGLFKKVLLRAEYNLDYFTINRANRIIVVNPSIKTYFQKKTSKNIDVIPIPIKSKNFAFSAINRASIRKELGIEDNAIVIGFVGRFSPEKNLFTLLVSFVKAAARCPLLKLVLVGTGPQEAHLREYVSNNSIVERVLFCGIRYDVNKILSSFDIFVLPSLVEGLSTAILEAMTCERAIICSDIPANRDFLTHNHDAILVNPLDANEIKKAIILLCNDNSLRLKLGHNARLNAEKYDESKIFPRILDTYKASSTK